MSSRVFRIMLHPFDYAHDIVTVLAVETFQSFLLRRLFGRNRILDLYPILFAVGSIASLELFHPLAPIDSMDVFMGYDYQTAIVSLAESSFSAPMVQEVVHVVDDAVDDTGVADCLFQVVVKPCLP